MLFMKGSSARPRCKFSRQMVELLNSTGVPYGTFDILGARDVRDAHKDFSGWRTYPALYVNGNLVGGLDVVKQLQEDGELGDLLPSALSTTAPAAAPAAAGGGGGGSGTGAAAAAAAAAAENPVTAAAVRRAGEALEERLKRMVSAAPAVLFMKGEPSQPRCGFSNRMVQLLQSEGVPFWSFDILTDEEVRQGLKEFSNWPTYPQLYAKGELVGGCDIIMELAESGELKETVA